MLMSVPRKHHYIPQVHIKKFESENGYFVYHKDLDKVVSKKSTNDIFVVKDLNTSLDEDGRVNHSILERQLELKWDSKFKHYFEIIDSWIKESIANNRYAEFNIDESLKFFFEYTLIGYHRAQKQDTSFNNSVLDPILGFEEIIPDLNELDTSDLEMPAEDIDLGLNFMKDFIYMATGQVKDMKDKLKFPAPVASDLSMFLPENLTCDFILTENQPFYLPDTTGVIIKSKEVFLHKNITLNKIAMLGVPISSNIFLRIKNQEFFHGEKTGVYAFSRSQVDKLNRDIISFSKRQTLVEEKFQL